MKNLVLSKLAGKILTFYMIVAVLLVNFPLSAFASGVSVSVAANGSTNLVLSGPTATFTVDVTSSNAVSCQLTSPTTSGIATSASMNINPGDPFYPTVGGSITFTVVCNDADGLGGTATASAVVSLPAPPSAVTTDIKANGSDGPVNLNTGDTYTYSWVSANAISCQMTSPVTSGISTSGNSVTISSGNPFYPPAGGSITLTITCTNGITSATDSVVINLASGGGGGPVVVTANLNANPTTVAANATSTLTWNSTNVTSCSAPWTASTATSGSQVVIVPATTTYSITCINGTQSVIAQATVTVTLPGGGGGGSCTLPTITSSLVVSTTVNQAFSYTITTTSTSTPNFVVNLGSLSPDLSFATSTRIISGTPTTVGTFNIILNSTNPCGSDNKTLVLTVNAAAGGGGGGGGGGGLIAGGGAAGGFVNSPPIGGSTHQPVGAVLGAEDTSCFYLHDYMRRDFNNDPIQVMKLQAFLKAFEGYDYVTINGVFDQATFNAVSAFQMKYEGDILTPWGETAPTGYVYILTLKKINEIYCQHAFPVNEAQGREIVAFRALLESLHNQGRQIQVNPNGSITIPAEGTSTPIELPVVGRVGPPKGQNLNSLAAAIVAGPKSLANGLECIYQFLIILITLYILANLLVDVLYKDDQNVLKKLLVKWSAICLGLLIVLIVAFILKDWCIILPILLALLFSIVWVSVHKKHDSIKASFKSWNMVLEARLKSILK